MQKEDLPGSPGVKTLPSNTGDTDSTPDRGTRVPHFMGAANLFLNVERNYVWVCTYIHKNINMYEW